MHRLLALSSLLVVAACASSQRSYEAKHLPDGTWRLKCQGSLPACIAHAEATCHGNNYEVLKARDQRDLFGPENGTAQVEVRSSEAIIRCGAKGVPAPPLPPDPSADDTRDPNATQPPEPSDPTHPPPQPVPPPVAQRACVPGSTQACIGPGRCEGGQSCLPDGSAYGPCDCGTLGPPPSAPSAPPPAPEPSAGSAAQPKTPPNGGTPAKPPNSTGPRPVRQRPAPPPPAGGASPLK